jgi:hypothetical protein
MIGARSSSGPPVARSAPSLPWGGMDAGAKKKSNKTKGGGPACRTGGHPCEGNQDCCEGLVCRVTGPGNAKRCAAPRHLWRQGR